MRAGERFFVDTSVLLYSADPADAARQLAARDWLKALWESGSGRLSWQVLHEFYASAVRKLRAHSTEARITVELFATWQPVDTSFGLIQRAWFWTDEAQVSYWDGLIVAAAERAGCAWLLSEDFQPGRKLGAMTVVDPFHTRPEAFD
jgi:predicted nucleic acid-binding protein